MFYSNTCTYVTVLQHNFPWINESKYRGVYMREIVGAARKGYRRAIYMYLMLGGMANLLREAEEAPTAKMPKLSNENKLNLITLAESHIMSYAGDHESRFMRFLELLGYAPFGSVDAKKLRNVYKSNDTIARLLVFKRNKSIINMDVAMIGVEEGRSVVHGEAKAMAEGVRAEITAFLDVCVFDLQEAKKPEDKRRLMERLMVEVDTISCATWRIDFERNLAFDPSKVFGYEEIKNAWKESECA